MDADSRAPRHRLPDGDNVALTIHQLTHAFRQDRRLWLLPLLVAVVWCWVDVMPRGGIYASPAEHRTDFTVYTEAGAAFFDGRDPYLVANPRGWHYLYPPLFAMAVAPLHAFEPRIQVAVWFFISLAALVGCCFEFVKVLSSVAGDFAMERKGTLRTQIVAATALAVLLPVLNCLQRGQVEVFKLYLLMLGLRILVCGTGAAAWFVAGFVFALPIVIKLTPALPVGALVLFEAVRALGNRPKKLAFRRTACLSGGLAAGLLCFAFVLPAAFLGWTANWHHLQTWYDGVASKAVDVRTTDFGENVRGMRNQSFDNAAYRFGNWLVICALGGPDDSQLDEWQRSHFAFPLDDPSSGAWIALARLAALGVFLAFVASAARSTDDRLARAVVVGLGCAASLVVCPVARGCYFLLLAPGLLFSAAWLMREGNSLLAKWLTFLMAGLVSLYYVWPMIGRLGLLGLGTTAWMYIVCIVLHRRLLQNRFGSPPTASLISAGAARVLFTSPDGALTQVVYRESGRG